MLPLGEIGEAVISMAERGRAAGTLNEDCKPNTHKGEHNQHDEKARGQRCDARLIGTVYPRHTSDRARMVGKFAVVDAATFVSVCPAKRRSPRMTLAQSMEGFVESQLNSSERLRGAVQRRDK